MQIVDNVRGYWRWTSGYSNPNGTAYSNTTNGPKHTYKPKAIRIPSLLSLLFLFIISLTGIELLLDRTVKPSEYYKNHFQQQPVKRQTQSQQCPSPEENSRSLSSLLSKQAELCTTYTTTFKPSTTDLPPSMQTGFDSWLAVYSSMEAELERAESCASSQSVFASLSSLLNPTVLTNSASTASQLTSGQTISQNTQSTSASSTQSGSQSATASQVSGTSQTTQQLSSITTGTGTESSVVSSSSQPSTSSDSSSGIVDKSSSSSTSTSEIIDSISTISIVATTTSISTLSTLSTSSPTPPTTQISTTSPTTTSSITQLSTLSSSTLTTTTSTISSSLTSVLSTSQDSSTTPRTTTIPTTTFGPFSNTTSTTLTTISSSTTEPDCTEFGSPCYSCGYDYCTCQSAISKRQAGLYCAVDLCHCVTDEEGNLTCGVEDTCAEPSSTISSTSEVETTGSTTTSQPECTELNSPCLACDYEYCTCQAQLTKRQDGALYCAVDPCHCLMTEGGEFSCSPEDLCASSSIPAVSTSTTSDILTTSSAAAAPQCTELNSPCFDCGYEYCKCQAQLTKRQEGALYCAVDSCHCATDDGETFDCSAENLCTTSSTNDGGSLTTTTLSTSDDVPASVTSPEPVTITSAQATCTETSGPCFECGYDYCVCGDDGQCNVDTCHCQESESGDYTCDGLDLCEPDTCTEAGETCFTCEASICECGTRLSKRQSPENLSCIPSQCSCQWNEVSSEYTCGDFNICEDICSGPVTPDGQQCYSCEADDCQCQENTCQPSPTTTSTTSSITAPPTCGTPGSSCIGCDAQQCVCNTQPTGAAVCEVDTCKCSIESSSWYCNTINTCTSTTTSTLEAPIPGATCNPSVHECYNCVAEKCACQSDATCNVDLCYCDYISPGQYSCGTINRCNPDACDESHLQCFGCNSDDEEAACYCSSEGVCSPTACPDCEFLEGGTVMTCPDSCDGIAKRSLDFNVTLDANHIDSRRSLTSGLNDTRSNQRNSAFLDGLKIPRFRNVGHGIDKRQAFEVVTGPTPLRDAWNYLLWTKPLTVRRTSSSIVSTVTAATFTLDVFQGGSTSWPSELIPTPPLAFRPTVPACIPATLIAPAESVTTIIKRDANLKSIKPYVTRESTTVVVRIRDNYMEMSSETPTITKNVPLSDGVVGAALQLSTQTIAVESIGSDGLRTTQSVVVIQPGGTRTAGSATKTSSGSGGGGGGGGGESGDNGNGDNVATLSASSRVVNMSFNYLSYVAALYFPAITAVVIKILFETMVASIKMMEPFERLHRSEGSSASESLSSQYLSSSLSLDTIRSIVGSGGRSIPLWSLIIYTLIAVGAPLSSASMSVQPLSTCEDKGFEQGCHPAWVVDLNFIRLLEALLAVCLALTLVLAWDSWKYHAGVPTNPTSIVSMAVLLNYEPLRHDLQGIDPDATDKEMDEALSEFHFWLLPHSPSRNQRRYGLIHSPVNREQLIGDNASWTRILSKLERVKQFLSFESRGINSNLKLIDALHLLTTAALLAILITYRSDLRNDAFNEFFASRKFAPKLILMCLATVLDMQWKNLEREVRITEPYRRLFAGNARPENTILCTLNGTCWSNLPRCLSGLWHYEGMWFEALIGFTAILSDVNIIAVSGVLLTASQTEIAYQWSSITALTTTSIMTAVLLLTVIWWRRTEAVRSLPRTPETVAAVLSYLCISQMAMDLAAMGMEHLSKEERDEIIISKNRRYRFGLMMGEDGKMRHCVDYDVAVADDGSSERESWLQEKVARPRPIRLSM